MEKFEGLDFYDIESLLTEEEIMIRDMVRDYVDEEVIPHIEKACEDGVFLDKWRQDLGEMGVLGAPLQRIRMPRTFLCCIWTNLPRIRKRRLWFEIIC